MSSNFFPEIREDPLRIDRAKRASMVRSQAIFRLLEPHRIKRGIGLVKTGNQTFHSRRRVIGREFKCLMQNGLC